MENQQENETITSAQQILNTANGSKLEYKEDLFDTQYALSQQDQSSNADAGGYLWTDGVTSELITQGFNQPHPFDSSMYQNNNSDQIPFHYSELEQNNSNMGIEPFDFSQHRNSLPMLQHDTAAMLTPSFITNALPSTTTMQPMAAPPYKRRYTEGAIPAASSASSSTTTTTTTTASKTPRKQRIGSVSSKEDDDDESKRKHFLERNRQAALKCRQRKKQWLANLQHRVEFLSTDNEHLQSQATLLREEVINLKTLLLAHRDCKTFNDNVASNGPFSLDGNKKSLASSNSTNSNKRPDNATG